MHAEEAVSRLDVDGLGILGRTVKKKEEKEVQNRGRGPLAPNRLVKVNDCADQLELLKVTLRVRPNIAGLLISTFYINHDG